MKDRRAEQTPSAVPERAPQDGEIRARWAWVEPVVWTERMLATLETGIEGGKWFRLTAQCLLHHGWPVLLKTGACCGLPIFFEVTTNWRAGCQKLACPVRREGRPESSLPLSRHACRDRIRARRFDRREGESRAARCMGCRSRKARRRRGGTCERNRIKRVHTIQEAAEKACHHGAQEQTYHYPRCR